MPLRTASALITTLLIVGGLPGQDEPLLARDAAIPLAITCGDGRLRIAVEHGPRLEGCQAYCASRVAADRPWEEERVDYRVVEQSGERLVLEAAFRGVKATVRCERTAPSWWRLSGTLVNTATTAIELARFHYLDGQVSDRTLNLLAMRQFELPGRLVRPDEALRPPREACERGWGGVYWPRLHEPIHERPDTAISGDSALLAADWNSAGFFIGFTGPGGAFGEIGIRTRLPATAFFVAVLLDAIRLEPGATRVLEQAVLTFGDGQDALRRWAGLCRAALGPARIRAPLVGYCSWYQTGQKVAPGDIHRALQGFAPFATPPGGRTIQIDDGFQVRPGDWNGRDVWATELPQMARVIAERGFIPGLWVAPTAIHASHPIVREHPDWLQRDAQGRPCIRFHNWRGFGSGEDRDTYFLEPDHPQARAWMSAMLKGLYAQGWRYFKLDFAYTVSDDRVKYDPGLTTFETLRSQWRLFREALGDDALINACNGGMWRYTIGTVDMARLGGDIGASPANLRRNLAEMMLRAHINGVWYQADPDVYYMRRERSRLNFEQSHLLTATQGLMGGAFLTSDFADQWDAQAQAVVQRYWNAQGPRVPAELQVTLTADGLPAALAVAYDRDHYALGIYNWQATARDVDVGLREVHLPTDRTFNARLDGTGGERITLAGGMLTVQGQPADSLRIIQLTTQAP